MTREELQKRLWPADTFVDFDRGLNAAINRVREALGDSAENPRFVETLPRRGYRFIGQVEGVAAPGSAQPEQPARGWPYGIPVRSWHVGVAFGAAILIIALLFFFPSIHRHTPTSRSVTPFEVPLTALPGQEISPSFSPDGSQVAFGWDGENNGAGFDLYIKVIGTDRPLRLTSHPAEWMGVAWSPDGRYIAVHRIDKENGGIFLVPALGGPERKLVSTNTFHRPGAAISWSPDGKQLAFATHLASTHVNSDQLFILTVDTLERIRVGTGCDHAYDPAFSPNGNTLAYACTKEFGSFSLNLRELRTGKDTRLLSGLQAIKGVTWSHDGARLIFSYASSAFITSTGGDLWQITPGQAGSPEKMPVGHDAISPAVSSAGSRLAYVQSRVNSNIWRVDLNGPEPQAHMLAQSTRQQYDPVISPDGRRVAFMSDRSGSEEIWVCDRDGGNAQQLTSLGNMSTGTPHWSQDSKKLAFDSRVGGEANVYVVDSDGGVPRKLETGTRMNSLPSWSHDGTKIYFACGPTDSSLTIWRVPATGGQATQLTKTLSSMPIESPDGQYVYFVRSAGDKVRLWRMLPDGSDENLLESIPPLRSNGYEWWLSGTGIYFYAHVNSQPEVDFLDFRTSRVRRIYTPDKPPAIWLGGLSISPDGKWLLYSRVDETTSDLVLVENFQ